MYRSLVQGEGRRENREESDLPPQPNNGGSELKNLASEGDKSTQLAMLESGERPSEQEEESSDREGSANPLLPDV